MQKQSGIVKMTIAADPLFLARLKKAGLMREGRKSMVLRKRSDIPFFLVKRFKLPAGV